MVDVSSQNNSVSINVSSGGNSASIKATPDMAQYYSEKSREWAISNRIVDNTDYSSKYYAEKSKESETKAENYERSVIEKYNSYVEVSNQAETELQTLKDDSISQINTVTSSGISDIANKASEAVTEINAKKETATNEINNAKNSAVTQLTKEAQEQLKNIESTGFYMRDDKLYFIDSNGEEKEFAGGSGFNLFDTKISDHILEGNEAKGWALQGTYVTKDLYPDFYNKCLEEYKDGLKNEAQPWQQPILSSDVTQTSEGEIVCTASSFFQSENCYPYCALDGVKSGNNTNYGRFVISNTKTGWWQVKFPYKLKITGLKYYAPYSSSAETVIATTGRFYTSSEKITPIGDEINTTKNWQEVNVANIPTEGIITDTIYFDITNSGGYGGIGELEITAIKINTIVTNANGHKFYPIAEKSLIDEIYNQYGIADFYGIDEENERVFLPRNKYFHQLTDDPTKVNQMVEAGLPNITGDSGYLRGLSVTTTNSSGALKYEAESGANSPTHNGSSGNVAGNILLDASVSNPIYGNSDTVQPPSSLKLLYYCVGNTVVNEANIDAGGLVAQMEQKANVALDNVMPSQDFIEKTISWGMPDYSSAISVSSLPYTAPADGVFVCQVNIAGGGNNACQIYVDDNLATAFGTRNQAIWTHTAHVLVPKNSVISNVGGNLAGLQFFPLKGAN